MLKSETTNETKKMCMPSLRCYMSFKVVIRLIVQNYAT